MLVVKDKKVRWKDIKAQQIMKIKRVVAEVRINADYVFHIGCGLHLCFVRTWHNTMTEALKQHGNDEVWPI